MDSRRHLPPRRRRSPGPSRRRFLRAAGATAAFAVAGCAEDGPAGETETVTDRPADAGAVRFEGETVGYTHVRPGRNRLLAGTGAMAGADPLTRDLDPSGRPAWLVATPSPAGSLWTVATADGDCRTLRAADGSLDAIGAHDPLPAGAPPVVTRGDRDGQGGSGAGVQVVGRPADAAPLTHPVPAGDGVLYVAENGDLVHRRDGSAERFAVDALPDARVVRVDADRHALFGGATDRYRHAALGDALEGGSLVVFDAAAGEVTARAAVGPPAVFEELAPLAADLGPADGPDLVTVVSDGADGARIAAYAPDGTRRATGPVHGSGWRHPLAVAPLGPDGGRELAVVRKPHVEQVLEFYRMGEDGLRVVATLAGFSSHTYGSRNLDGAVAGDLDGDGRHEVLVPSAARGELRAVRRTGGGAEVAWRHPLDGGVASNLAGTTLPDGRAAVGVVDGQGTLRVWQAG